MVEPRGFLKLSPFLEHDKLLLLYSLQFNYNLYRTVKSSDKLNLFFALKHRLVRMRWSEESENKENDR